MGDVELIPAVCWICPTCGQDNFARAVTPELTDEQMDEIERELLSDMGVDSESVRYTFIEQAIKDAKRVAGVPRVSQEWAAGQALGPESVTCKECGETFQTTRFLN